MKPAISTYALTFLLAACATAPVGTATSPATAQDALRAYYGNLEIALPVAPRGPPLSADALLTHFAFGSCQNEERKMDFWNVIAAQKPQAFLLIGDNVYGDVRSPLSAELPTLIASYKKLNARVEFDRFRRTVPMLTTWDDHDLGGNDVGGSFAFKEWAERIFEKYWSSAEEVRARSGVYDSHIVGPAGKRVQFILLDTRSFRSDLVSMPYRDPAPPLGWYIPNTDPKATVLGEAQWEWLKTELAKPAELRFIVSSIQVETSAHQNESWANFPRERERLYALFAAMKVDNAILFSGDRHAGAFYKTSVPGVGKPLWEITSSSLNFAFGKGNDAAREPDPLRTGGLWSIPNFAVVDVDWTKKLVNLSLRRDDNSVIEEQSVEPF